MSKGLTNSGINIGLVLILLLYAGLSLALSLSIPLGEAPDEPAHFSYVRFLARHGRPPITLAERDEVGYRAKWPPLYHGLIAPIVRLTETDGPDSLKLMHADSRRLLPLGGFVGMTFLHTDDEAFPYRGIVAAWHAGRLASALLGAGTLVLIFLTLRRTFSTGLTLAAVLAVGLIPGFVTISAVINDDNLLGFMLALFLWLLWPLFDGPGSPRQYLALGLVAGAALLTKYSALFLPLSLLWLHWLLKRPLPWRQALYFGLGYLLSVGWWFLFVIYYFNQIETFGLLRGVIAPFLAGGADLTTRQLATFIGVDSVYTPPPAHLPSWTTWLGRLFVTLWYPAGTARFWMWFPLLLGSIVPAVGLGLTLRRAGPAAKESSPSTAGRMIWFALGYTLLFIPLPVLRFLLSQNIAETAQGRHLLFPLLLPLALLLLLGLRYWFGQRSTIIALLGLAVFFLLTMLAVVWPQITFAGFPYLPVQTSLTEPPETPLQIEYAAEIELLGLGRPAQGSEYTLPLTLIWQAGAMPAVDYLTRLEVRDRQGALVGLWQGQPVNGRYPTRAWDEGDVVYDRIWIPMLPGQPSGDYTVSLQVFDDLGHPVPSDAGQSLAISLGDDFSYVAPAGQAAGTPRPVLAPRGDRLATADSYSYRSTVAAVIVGDPPPAYATLVEPGGERHEPAALLTGPAGMVVIFNVDWRWPSDRYDLVVSEAGGLPGRRIEAVVSIRNSQRLSEPPPISRPVKANFNNLFMLLGYDLPVTRVEPGQNFEITLYWQSLRTTNTGYKLFNHLLDANQVQYGGWDRVPQLFYSTVLWNPGEIVSDRYQVPVYPDAPDGVYWLDIGWYPDGDIHAPALPLVADDQVLDKHNVLLGPVKVGGQPKNSRPQSPPEVVRSDQFGSVITLSGYNLRLYSDRRLLDLDLYWSPTATPSIDYTLFAHLVDESGRVVVQADGPPVQGIYPTSFWEPGEQIFDARQVSLADLPAGEYRLRIGWYDPTSGERLPVPGNPENFILLDEFELE